MKSQMSSFDILAAVGELKEIKGARINKVYQVSPAELRLQLHVKGEGRKDLVIEVGRRLHLTRYPKPAPQRPSNFAMTLRKYVQGGFIEDIRQLAFDRIVSFEIAAGGTRSNLIAELFGTGNALLLDSENVIKAVMKPKRYRDRDLVGKETYERPPQKADPFELSARGLADSISSSEKELVKVLASDLGLGGEYAEELCALSGVGKNSAELSKGEAEKLIETLQELRRNLPEAKARIIYDDGKAVDVTPLALRANEGKAYKEFDSFNAALDEYFSPLETERVEGIVEKRYSAELGKLQKRLEDQEKTLARFEHQEKDSRVIGDLIYQNYQQIDGIIGAMSKAIKDHSPKEILAKLKESGAAEAAMIGRILPKTKEVEVEIGGKTFLLDLKKNAAKNADAYYKRGKKAKEKQEGTSLAIEKTRHEIEKFEAEGMEAISVEEAVPKKREPRKKEWYERFRWFTSSDGMLVIGGRDATSNEVVVKSHMDKSDLFVHADIHGAPAVIIKSEGKEIPQSTIDEAFVFAASYSRAWKNGIFALNVYSAKPEQVSKTPEHGEYVPKGAFIVRGKREWKKVGIALAAGIVIGEEPRVIAGPPSAVAKNAKYSVEIAPGRMKSREAALAIRKRWLELAGGEDREKISRIKPEDIQELLPPGTHEVK